MKKILWLLLFLVLCGIAFTACSTRINKEDYIRIHIRADSNEEDAQSVKLLVRDEIVAYLTKEASGVSSKSEMKGLIINKLDYLTELANNVLRQNGFAYTAEATLGKENFPTKSYGELTLPEGEYEALIIKLGKGEGDNWWCVAYPPLCFIASEDKGEDGIEYKSVIKEFFDGLKRKDEGD